MFLVVAVRTYSDAKENSNKRVWENNYFRHRLFPVSLDLFPAHINTHIKLQTQTRVINYLTLITIIRK